MALYLEQQLPTGVTVNYHKIGHVQIDYCNKWATCAVLGYIDEDSRRAENMPVVTTALRVPALELTDCDIRKTIYHYLNENIFLGATSV